MPAGPTTVSRAKGAWRGRKAASQAQRRVCLRSAHSAPRRYGADAAETVETHLFAALRATRLIAADATWSQCGYSRCGRTDKGVSAVRQLVALRVRAASPGAEALDYVALLNRQLPADIRVLSWRPAPQDFSARFSARWRQYKYFFWDDGRFDLDAMRDAAARLVVRGVES